VKKGWIPILVFSVITLSSLLPGRAFSDSSLLDINHLDKYLHIAMYFFGSFSLGYFLNSKKIQKIRSWILLCVLVTAYGVLLEEIQEWIIPGRGFELLDIIANFIGTILGLAATWIIVKNRNYGN
jgi:VanZ family protein